MIEQDILNSSFTVGQALAVGFFVLMLLVSVIGSRWALDKAFNPSPHAPFFLRWGVILILAGSFLRTLAGTLDWLVSWG